jgi:hypothetical protein
MKMMRRELILVAAVAAICVTSLSCSREQAPDAPTVTRFNVDDIKPGPTRHDSLTPEQVGRIRKLQVALAEVDDSSLEKWIDDFRGDADPDREIAVFEAVAQAYQAFCSSRPRTQAQKQDAFGLLLERSGTSEEDTLGQHKLKVLTLTEAKEALSYYNKEATPIQVRQR